MQQQTMLPEYTTANVDIGAEFKRAREARNLSFEDVAKEIALRPSILKSIEDNQFTQKDTPAMFMQGYVRSYAKFLRLPNELWENINFGYVPQNDLDKNARKTYGLNHYTPHNRWIGWITALVLFVVAIMTGIWWWENHQKDNTVREQLVQNFDKEAVNVEATQQSSSVMEANSIPLNIQPISASEDTVTAVPSNQQTSTSKENATKGSVSAPATNVLSAQADILNNATPIEEPSVREVSPLATQGDFVIEITGDCWISVKNKNNNVLAEDLYKAGDVLKFNGNDNEPYSVIIGAPINVKVNYKGKAYPLKVDGRVARFNLPQ